MKILIVEDEHRLSDNIRDYLAPQGYLCEQAFDYNQAKMMSGSYDYDCVLLDLMLPGGSGLDVLKAIRKKNMETGVIGWRKSSRRMPRMNYRRRSPWQWLK